MKGYCSNIASDVASNNDFRRVVYTGGHSQLVLMSLAPGEEIGLETHYGIDQFFRFEFGNGKVTIDGNEYEVAAGSAAIVPAGAEHNVINTSHDNALKLSTIYSPANHKDGIVRATKQEANENRAAFDGRATE